MLLGQANIQDPKTGVIRPKFKNTRDTDFEGQITRINGLLLIRFEEGMFFGNVGQLKERLKRIEIHGDLGVHPGEEPRVNTVIPVPSATAATVIINNSQSLESEETWEDQTLQSSPNRTNSSIFGVVFDMKSVSEIDARYILVSIVFNTTHLVLHKPW